MPSKFSTTGTKPNPCQEWRTEAGSQTDQPQDVRQRDYRALHSGRYRVGFGPVAKAKREVGRSCQQSLEMRLCEWSAYLPLFLW